MRLAGHNRGKELTSKQASNVYLLCSGNQIGQCGPAGWIPQSDILE